MTVSEKKKFDPELAKRKAEALMSIIQGIAGSLRGWMALDPTPLRVRVRGSTSQISPEEHLQVETSVSPAPTQGQQAPSPSPSPVQAQPMLGQNLQGIFSRLGSGRILGGWNPPPPQPTEEQKKADEEERKRQEHLRRLHMASFDYDKNR